MEQHLRKQPELQSQEDFLHSIKTSNDNMIFTVRLLYFLMVAMVLLMIEVHSVGLLGSPKVIYVSKEEILTSPSVASTTAKTLESVASEINATIRKAKNWTEHAEQVVIEEISTLIHGKDEREIPEPEPTPVLKETPVLKARPIRVEPVHPAHVETPASVETPSRVEILHQPLEEPTIPGAPTSHVETPIHTTTSIPVETPLEEPVIPGTEVPSTVEHPIEPVILPHHETQVGFLDVINTIVAAPVQFVEFIYTLIRDFFGL